MKKQFFTLSLLALICSANAQTTLREVIRSGKGISQQDVRLGSDSRWLSVLPLPKASLVSMLCLTSWSTNRKAINWAFFITGMFKLTKASR